MAESDDHLPSLDSLQRRIDKAETQSGIAHTGRGTRDETSSASRNGLAEATRLAWGLVAGGAVGCAGGYLLDRWLGTSPVFFIVCFFLGFAAGLYTLMREVGRKS